MLIDVKGTELHKIANGFAKMCNHSDVAVTVPMWRRIYACDYPPSDGLIKYVSSPSSSITVHGA